MTVWSENLGQKYDILMVKSQFLFVFGNAFLLEKEEGSFIRGGLYHNKYGV